MISTSPTKSTSWKSRSPSRIRRIPCDSGCRGAAAASSKWVRSAPSAASRMDHGADDGDQHTHCDEEPTENERYEGPRAAGRLDLLADQRDDEEEDREDHKRRAQLDEERGGPRQPVFRRSAV